MPALPDLAGIPEGANWPALLAALEASIAARDATIFDGAPPPPALPLPESSCTIPVPYAARARAVLDAIEAQQERLGNELARVQLELARVTRAESGNPRRAAEARAGGFEARA